MQINTIENKEKRKNYVTKILRRTRGMSKNGQIAVVKIPKLKGPNVHMIGGLSSSRILNFKTKRNSYKITDCN
ncbi:hypothetical protein AYI68_g7428 [Smittium mucronatum]|uniref:Uncharacterized protein n=1 Tax=Smittium mucronatum TaxID=133383 RepID=A0A1R0GNP9_9FUNG|nr:hypothetical protein AYI68_g7428 [Smittium mucronatum]